MANTPAGALSTGTVLKVSRPITAECPGSQLRIATLKVSSYWTKVYRTAACSHHASHAVKLTDCANGSMRPDKPSDREIDG